MAKVLVIDDDALVRYTVARILQRAGHEVLLPNDGRQGTELFRSASPDLVITDIIMPEQEGIQTIREIRSLCADAKIVAISGGPRLVNVDVLKMAAMFGANEVIAKPFQPAELVSSVERCLASAA